jgi:L-ascorbate metabolism protein UlaG (beta-lactamase superfamily)
MPVEITWLGHASVMIKDGACIVFIDPWKTEANLPKADFILVTHDHRDHYSGQDVEALSKDTTRVIAPMPTPLVTNLISPGETLHFGKVTVAAIPAYNIKKKFHPKENGWVGYVINLSGKSIYYAGDTDNIPEMKEMDVDAALIPVGGTYTMDALEAARAVDSMKVGVVIPTHFGDIVGSREDAQSLARNTKKEIRILDAGESYTLV